MKRSVAVLVALIVVVVALWWRHDRARSSKPRGAVGAELAGGRERGAAGKPAPDDPRALAQATIRGTVRTVGGGPIAGAQVCAHFATDGLASDEWRTPPCATTDAAGAYALEHLLPVRHGVAASAAGHQAREWQNAQGEPDSFVLAPGEVRTVDFALPPGGAEVRGTVEDVSGGPIVGALVAISSGDLENVAATARTDAQGRFSLWSAAGPVRLRAQADGYTPGASAVTAPTARAQLSLTPESSLAGTVVTAGDARPVADAIVAVALDDDDGGEASARSDAQGRFRLTRLVPGRYHPRASGDGYRGDAVASVLLGLGQSVDGIEIVVHPASRVRGTVVIDRGGGKVEPCPRGAVMLTDPASHVCGRDSFELDGAFAILALAPGRYEARVRCNGHAAQRQYPPVEVAAGADVTGLVFTVTPGAVITGTARTTAGAPVAAAWVSARATDAGDVFPGAFARSGDDGVYHLTGLRGGTYELEASARGQTDAEVPAAVTVAPGGVATADVVFPASGAVAGVVVDPAGRPQAGLLVSAGGRWLDAAATTGDDGAFRLDGVEPGQHGVTVSRGRYDPVRRPRAAAGDDRGESVVVVAGQTTTVRLVVEPQDGVITGIVRTDAASRWSTRGWSRCASQTGRGPPRGPGCARPAGRGGAPIGRRSPAPTAASPCAGSARGRTLCARIAAAAARPSSSTSRPAATRRSRCWALARSPARSPWRAAAPPRRSRWSSPTRGPASSGASVSRAPTARSSCATCRPARSSSSPTAPRAARKRRCRSPPTSTARASRWSSRPSAS